MRPSPIRRNKLDFRNRSRSFLRFATRFSARTRIAFLYLTMRTGMILIICICCSCVRESSHSQSWSDGVVYEVFVRSYYDSDGDGIGDLKGLEMKLDYIRELGVNAIWLMPIFESPSYHGYDVTDYYKINKDYGTMEDFESLMAACKRKGLKVVLDLVLNHTSSQNPWFLKSLLGEAPFDTYYLWRDEPPGGDWRVYTQRASLENGGWRYHNKRSKYFYAFFDASMPDLNMENPAVRTEAKNIAKFWLEKGVDGFRLDAAQNIIEEGPGDGLQFNSPSTVEWWIEFSQFVKSVNPEALLVGEIWASPDVLARYYAHGRGLDLCFNFPLEFAMLHSLKTGTADSIIAAIQMLKNQEAPFSYFAPFLSNHDQERIMTTLEGNEKKARLAAVLLLTAPGTPFLYYGEEIGMHQSVFSHATTRTPMQWSNETVTAGFTSGNKPWAEPGNNTDPFNVGYQLNTDNSLFRFYQSLLTVRKTYPALRYGDYKFHKFDHRIIAFNRIFKEQDVSVFINLSDSVREIDFPKIEGTYKNLVNQQKVVIREGFSLQPYESLVLKRTNLRSGF